MGAQVKTPRFYVDMPTFLHATGQMGWDDGKGGAELLYMNPSNPYTVNAQTSGELTPFMIGSAENNTPKTSFPINFVGLLNHNLAFNDNEFLIVGKHGLNDDVRLDIAPSTDGEILNADFSGTEYLPYYNGTTIFKLDTEDEYWRSFSVYYNAENPINARIQQLGSFVVGRYWDTPNSPDLSLTMSRRFEGIKTKKTMGGKTLSNIYYDGPTEWTMNAFEDTYKYPPFELDTTFRNTGESNFNKIPKSGLGRKGMRSWNLTFSYISESNMWMENESSNTIIRDDVSSNEFASS